MPDAQLIPVNILDNENYRYTRRQWMNAGVDLYTEPPAQNPDMLEAATNVMPPITNAWSRRYGYRTFGPKLDQGVGTANDETSNAILYGAGFNGVTGYVATTQEVIYPLGSPLTIEFWFETQSILGGTFVSLNNHKSPTSGETLALSVYLNTSGYIGLSYSNSNSATTSLVTSTAVNDGKLHYVAAIISGATATIYVDGVSAATSTTYSLAAISDYYWRLADADASDTPDYGFVQAFLSHVAIYPFALSAAQVTLDYNALTGATGSQANYESTVKGNAPQFFWYLTEVSSGSAPVTVQPIVQTAWINAFTPPYQITLSAPTTLGNTILVIFDEAITGSAISVSGITDNLSNSYTKIAGTNKLYAYYAAVTKPGTTTITVTFSSNPSQVQILAQELGGFVPTGILDATSPADYETSPSLSHASPIVTTSNAPDIVFSAAFANGGRPLTVSSTGQGWSVANSVTVELLSNGSDCYLGLAYTSGLVTGSYQDVWTASTSSTWQTVTFGLKLAANAATGTIAYDYVGRNNGTYSTAPSIPNNAATTSPSAASSFTVSIADPSPAINTGDTAFLMLNIDPTPGGSSGASVSSITDSVGNTWTNITPSQTYVNSHSRTATFQTWAAGMVAPIPSTSTLTITITMNMSVTPVISFFNIPGITTIDQQNQNSGTGSSGSSGGVTTTAIDFLLSLVACSTSITGTPSDFTEFVGTSAGANNSQAAYYTAMGTITDTWTFGSSGNFDVALVAYLTALGFGLGESVNT